jgi:hypothetical protein
MKENEGSDEAFIASKGWFANFKQRNQTYDIKLTVEAAPLEEESMKCCSLTARFCRRGGVKKCKQLYLLTYFLT